MFHAHGRLDDTIHLINGGKAIHVGNIEMLQIPSAGCDWDCSGRSLASPKTYIKIPPKMLGPRHHCHVKSGVSHTTVACMHGQVNLKKDKNNG